jgi:predicted nucleic acid-binding protein
VAVVVVDASVVAAILFGEATAEDAVERLDGSELAAPSLLPYEIASVAGGKVRRGEASSEVAVMSLGTFARMGIAMHDPDVVEVLRLTVRTGLTAYDAAYLWLARFLSADLVTLDGKLARVWSKLTPSGSRSRVNRER